MTTRWISFCLLVTGCGNQLTKPIPECNIIFESVMVGDEKGTTRDPCRDDAPEMKLPTDISPSHLRFEHDDWFVSTYFRTGEVVFLADIHTPRSSTAMDGAWNTASGSYGYQYDGVEGTSTYQLTILAPSHVRSTLSVTVTGSGRVSDGLLDCRSDGGICAASYGLAESIPLIATPDAGWVLESAAGCESLIDRATTISSDTECTIVFARESGGENVLTIAVQGLGDVLISGEDRACRSNETCEISVPEGTVTLTARPDVERRYQFAGWQGCASGDENPLSLSIAGATSCTAVFEPRPMTDCNGAPPITPGVIQLLDSERNVLGTSDSGECTIMIDRSQTFTLRAEGFVSAVTANLMYAWDIDGQPGQEFVTDEYGQEIQVQGDGFVACRGVRLKATDECGLESERYVTFAQQ